MDPAEESISQESQLEEWLRSEDARHTATRLVVKYRLDIEASELLHETWVKLTASVQRGNSTFDQLTSPADVAKYAYRTMDNLCRDHLRSRQRRNEIILSDEGSGSIPIIDHGFDSVEQHDFLEQLLYAVGSVVERRPTCAGCSKGVAEAAALQAVHLLLAGDDAPDSNRPWLDQLLYRALDIVDSEQSHRAPDARRQRKARCGRCARDILAEALSSMGFAS
jgi:DNA-directed RNA polymerase specialized sigma24 family protein